MGKILPILFLLGAFALAVVIEPARPVRETKSALDVFIGDGRKLFASHFFSKADVYFHKGYYPSMFDQMPSKSEAHEGETAEEHAAHSEKDGHEGESPEEHAAHSRKEGHEGETPEEHAAHSDHDAHEREMDFLGDSRDWIEAFGRNFFVSKHAHMENAEANELLPWFRIAAELDPEREETYTTAAYWLRQLKKPAEAEKFLREGWKINPDSYEILIELGRVYYFDFEDLTRARNVWELALDKWAKQQAGKMELDLHPKQEIVAHLGGLEFKAGRPEKMIEYLEVLKDLSPQPEVIKAQIAEAKEKLRK